MLAQHRGSRPRNNQMSSGTQTSSAVTFQHTFSRPRDLKRNGSLCPVAAPERPVHELERQITEIQQETVKQANLPNEPIPINEHRRATFLISPLIIHIVQRTGNWRRLQTARRPPSTPYIQRQEPRANQQGDHRHHDQRHPAATSRDPQHALAIPRDERIHNRTLALARLHHLPDLGAHRYGLGRSVKRDALLPATRSHETLFHAANFVRWCSGGEKRRKHQDQFEYMHDMETLPL